MRTALKVVGGLLVVLLVAAGGTLLFFSSKGQAKIDKVWTVQTRTVPVPQTDEGIAEGKRLFVVRGCSECHGPDGAGVVVFDDEMGTFGGADLTPNGRLPSMSDQQVAQAVLHGVGPDGKALLGMMPEFATLADAELGPIIAWLRTLPKGGKPGPKVKLSVLGRAMLGFGELDLAAEQIDHEALAKPPAVAVPEAGPTAEYGAWLAKGRCAPCHTETYAGTAPAGKSAKPFPMPTNITPDATGIGGWSFEQFETAVRKGKRPDGSELAPLMPWAAFSQLTDVEVTALWTYLRTVPAKASKVE